MRLKTMVPVSLRSAAEANGLGNRISFVFVDLPCDEPDPVRRVRAVARSMGSRKDANEPEGADTIMRLVGDAPRTLQRVASRLVSSPRSFDLVVSNIPGPPEPLWMLGCGLEEAYPYPCPSARQPLAVGRADDRLRRGTTTSSSRSASMGGDATWLDSGAPSHIGRNPLKHTKQSESQ